MLFSSPEYYDSLWATAVFSTGVAAVSLGSGLLLATFVDHIRRGRAVYKSLIIWPYAVAPVLAGVLWLFLFHPIYGVVAFALARGGMAWNPLLDSNRAMALVVMAAAWKQVSYNFVFFLAGLQAIPRSVIEAAAIDGAGPMYRFRTIILPLLTPRPSSCWSSTSSTPSSTPSASSTPSPMAGRAGPPTSWSTRCLPTASSARTWGRPPPSRSC